MGLFKERERPGLDVEERTENISPLSIERKEVVTPSQTVFTAQVKDDKGQPLIETPENKEVTIEIPNSQGQLNAMSKGSSDDTLTWFARFWMRMIEKAASLGWRIVRKPV